MVKVWWQERMGYDIVAAKKIKRRKNPEDLLQQSLWALVVKDRETNQLRLQYSYCESNPTRAPGSISPRGSFEERQARYARTGGSGTAKELQPVLSTAEDVPLPAMLLKSLHRSCWRQAPAEVLEDMRFNARYMRMQGYMAYAGKRHDSGKPYQIMQLVGEGINLYGLNQRVKKGRSTNYLRVDKPEASKTGADRAADATKQRSFVLALARVMAVIAKFHRNEGRPILDIKPDNLIPVMNPDGSMKQLVVIDLDGSRGDLKSYSPLVCQYDSDDLDRIRAAGKPTEIERSIDFRALANTLFMLSGDCDMPGRSLHPKTCFAEGSDLRKLYHGLRSTHGNLDARAVLSDALGADHEALAVFDTACVEFDANSAALDHSGCTPTQQAQAQQLLLQAQATVEQRLAAGVHAKEAKATAEKQLPEWLRDMLSRVSQYRNQRNAQSTYKSGCSGAMFGRLFHAGFTKKQKVDAADALIQFVSSHGREGELIKGRANRGAHFEALLQQQWCTHSDKDLLKAIKGSGEQFQRMCQSLGVDERSISAADFLQKIIENCEQRGRRIQTIESAPMTISLA